MVLFINQTGVIGQVIIDTTINLTGNLTLTLFLLFLLIMALFVAFRLPPILSAIFVLPLTIVIASFHGMMIPVLAALLIYLGVVMGTHYFLYR